LRVNSNTRGHGEPPYGNFELDLVTHPGELARLGKGAAHCYRRRPDRIFVWSIGIAGSA
jgi:hypothetical protein